MVLTKLEQKILSRFLGKEARWARIKVAAKARGIDTKAGIARLAEMDQSVLYRVVERKGSSIESWARIATALGVTVDFLIMDELDI